MIGEIIDYSQGSLELNVGSWVRLLERASGVPALIIGKPSPFGFELALESMNLDRKQVVVVGDQLGTDIRGAQGVGLASILVRSGEYAITPEDADVKADLEVSAFSDVKTLF
jgi:ribonucleotide monophosphatase NagD (HAD superfamily)